MIYLFSNLYKNSYFTKHFIFIKSSYKFLLKKNFIQFFLNFSILKNRKHYCLNINDKKNYTNMEENNFLINKELQEKNQFKIIQEGKATILFPKDNEVFYNPVQEVNRFIYNTSNNYYNKYFLKRFINSCY